MPDKAGETTAIPALIERLAVDGDLQGALVSIDAIATNAAIAGAIRKAGADYLLAVKANQPTCVPRSRRCSPTPIPMLRGPARSTST